MQYDAELADQLVDIRDVVESFRRCRVTPVDWRDKLRGAVIALRQIQVKARLNDISADLIEPLNLLLSHGLENEFGTVVELADKVETALRSVRIAGMPRPEDADWSFDRY